MERFHIFRECSAYFSLHFEPKIAFLAWKLAKIHHFLYRLCCIRKSGLHGFLSKFLGMSSIVMRRAINSGIVNGCTSFAWYVAIKSDFHFFAFFCFFLKTFHMSAQLGGCSLFFALFWAQDRLSSLKIGKDSSFQNFKKS
jgi:hypothetical protein